MFALSLQNVLETVHIHGPYARDDGVALADALAVAELAALAEGVIVGSPAEPALHS